MFWKDCDRPKQSWAWAARTIIHTYFTGNSRRANLHSIKQRNFIIDWFITFGFQFPFPFRSQALEPSGRVLKFYFELKSWASLILFAKLLNSRRISIELTNKKRHLRFTGHGFKKCIKFVKMHSINDFQNQVPHQRLNPLVCINFLSMINGSIGE